MKLLRREPGSDALRAELECWASLASSRLAWIEVRRAAVRAGVPPDITAAVLEVLDEIPLDERVVEAAATLEPEGLRTLDAVHVGTALTLGDRLGVLLTYDRRMSDAAAGAGLVAGAPAGD